MRLAVARSERDAAVTTAAVPIAGAPLCALLDALEAASRDRPDLEAHIRAFIAWITGNHDPFDALATLAAEAAALGGGARTYRHVAVLGFAEAAAPGTAPENDTALLDGIEWLAGREWFAVGRVPTFEADAVALLGVALGVRNLRVKLSSAPESDRTVVMRLVGRVSELLSRSLMITTEPWERGLIWAAQVIALGAEAAKAELRATAPDLAIALVARGILTVSPADERAALDAIFGLSFRGSGADRAATQLVALRWFYSTMPSVFPGRATRADVIAIVRGVARSLRRWRWENVPSTRGATLVRWAINNEYHVQDLLWAVLAPVFPDLEDEENLPSLGQKHPRYDIGVPSLKLIVEAKFVYRGDRREFSQVIEQVAADASLYLRDKARYAEIVVVVWDDSRHTEQYAELEQGLLSIPGVVSAVVLTRPGRMGTGTRGGRENPSTVDDVPGAEVAHSSKDKPKRGRPPRKP